MPTQLDNILDILDEKADIKHQHVERDIADLDRVKYRGGWINGLQYRVNDMVTHAKALFICVTENKNVDIYNETYWDLISAITSKEVRFIGGGGGGGGTSAPPISDHSSLNNLDYAVSGHTGFQPAGSYLTEETDPIYTSDKTDIVFDGDNISRLVNDAGYLTAETDPVFSASASFAIESTDILNWNVAYGWGDHASAGYALDTSLSNYLKLDFSNLPNTPVYEGLCKNGHSLELWLSGQLMHTWTPDNLSGTPVGLLLGITNP